MKRVKHIKELKELKELLSHMAKATQKSIKLLEDELKLGRLCPHRAFLLEPTKLNAKTMTTKTTRTFFSDLKMLNKTMNFAVRTPKAFLRNQIRFQLSRDLHHGTRVANEMSKHLKGRASNSEASGKYTNIELVGTPCKTQKKGKETHRLYKLFLKIYRSLYRSSVILLRARFTTHAHK